MQGEHQGIYRPKDEERPQDSAHWKGTLDTTADLKRIVRSVSWMSRQEKEEIEDKLQKKTEKIGFLLEYSFWCAVTAGHPDLCRKSSVAEIEFQEKREFVGPACARCGGIGHATDVCTSLASEKGSERIRHAEADIEEETQSLIEARKKESEEKSRPE